MTEHLRGYRLRDYDDLIATLALSRESQRITLAEVADRIGNCYLQQVHNWLRGVECRGRRVFDLADALGYDLALIPRETEPVVAASPGAYRDLVTGAATVLVGHAPETAPASTLPAEPAPARGSGYTDTAEAPSGPCDCGHEGLDEMFHLRPCPVAERRVAKRRAAEGAQTSTGDDA